MKKKHIGLIIGILISIVFLLIILKSKGCIGGSEGVKVTLDTAAYHDIIETVDASGKIYPETEVKIKADVSGEIVLLPVLEGDSVTKGQLLMKIDPVIYKTEVIQSEAETDRANAAFVNAQQIAAQAKAQYEKKLADFNRNKKLYEGKIISSSEFEQFKSDYLAALAAYNAANANISGSKFGIDAAKASLTQSRENLNKTIITAPTSGIISQLLVKNGERVVGTQQMDGTQLMTIANLGRMEVRVEVSETDIPKVNVGDTTIIHVDAYSNQTFTGIVSKIAVSSVALNSATGNTPDAVNTDEVTNYTVHILILPQSYKTLSQKIGRGKFVFKPGMSAGVEIQTKRVGHTLAVPINAVTTRSKSGDGIANSNDSVNSEQALNTVVFVYNKITGKVASRVVKTGVQDNTYIQILSGLKKGDQVVVAPYSAIARTLSNNTAVTPVSKEQLYQSEGGG